MSRWPLILCLTLGGMLIVLAAGGSAVSLLRCESCMEDEPTPLPAPSYGSSLYLDIREPKLNFADAESVPADRSHAMVGFEAMTWREFNRELWLWHSEEQIDKSADGSIRVTVRLTHMSVRISLDQTIYLPPDVSDSLREHEQVHRRLTELWYDKFPEEVTRIVHGCLIGRAFDGTGPTVEAANQDARDRMADAFDKEMDLHLYGRIAATHRLFDLASDHDRNGLSDFASVWATKVGLAGSDEAAETRAHEPAAVLPDLLDAVREPPDDLPDRHLI